MGIYAFNEKMEKVDIMTLTSSQQTVAQDADATFDITPGSSLEGYVVISAMVINIKEGYENYELNDDTFPFSFAFIKAQGTSSDFFRVRFTNKTEGSATVKVRIVLMKVA